MPLLTATVSTANTVYQVSLIVLLVGAALVVVSAIAMIASNSIRERELNDRLASLADAAAKAKAEVQKANAEVATAHQQVIAAQTAEVKLEKEISDMKGGGALKPVLAGRQVTVENCGLFINFVKTAPKGRVVVEAISSNEEASQFAKQISDMVKSAGYDVTENFGSATLLGDQPVGVQMKIRSMEEQPAYAGSLQRGLEFIGINTTGALDASAGDEVVLYIGSKP